MKILVIVLFFLNTICQAQLRNTMIIRYEDSTLTNKQMRDNSVEFEFSSTKDLKHKLDTLSNKHKYNSLLIYFDDNIHLPRSFFSFTNTTYININASKLKSTDKRLKQFKKLEAIEILCDTLENIDVGLAKIPNLSHVFFDLYALRPILQNAKSETEERQLIPVRLRKIATAIINKKKSKSLIVSINGVGFYYE